MSGPLERLFVACGPGLEPALQSELGKLGHSGIGEPGGVALELPPGSHMRLNLWLRVGGRVLLRVGEYPAPRALAQQLELGPWLPKGQRVRVEASGDGTRPWVEAVAQKFGAAPDGPALYLRVARGRCTVSVDTTGDNLYLRGYRQELGRAPMRETLAAGVLTLAGYEGGPLWDVMCGSGTLLIEGALLARGRAPGALRTFAFERFPSFDKAAFEALPREAPREGALPRLLGTDLNSGALGTARRNARRAGVLEAVTLERQDATKLVAPAGLPPGLVVANLPYGKRVGENVDLVQLAKALGASLRASLPGWRFALLMAEGVEALGLRVDRSIALDNGGIPVRLVQGKIPVLAEAP